MKPPSSVRQECDDSPSKANQHGLLYKYRRKKKCKSED